MTSLNFAFSTDDEINAITEAHPASDPVSIKVVAFNPSFLESDRKIFIGPDSKKLAVEGDIYTNHEVGPITHTLPTLIVNNIFKVFAGKSKLKVPTSTNLLVSLDSIITVGCSITPLRLLPNPAIAPYNVYIGL